MASLKFLGVENWPPPSLLMTMEISKIFEIIHYKQLMVNNTNIVKC